MKKIISSVSFVVFISLLILSCSSVGQSRSDQELLNEDDAIERLASDISMKSDILKDKKIGIFYFSTLEGKENAAGKRLSKKLLEKLIKNGGLIFVERSEIDKLLKAQGIEQTGIVDTESIKESGKVYSIDVMINGTIARVNKNGELSIKAVNLSTGQIYLVSSVNFTPSKNLSIKENPTLTNLNRESPEKLEIINRTFFMLEKLSQNRPVIFLMSVMNREDVQIIRQQNPKLGRVIKRTSDQIRINDPQLGRTIQRLRKGLEIVRDHTPEKFEILMRKKEKLISASPPETRPNRRPMR